jgi:(p)ppGpp synthase/HD superfamily hydrolase
MKYQIRSEEMHRVAEFGVAAHWDYKLHKKMIESLPGASLSGGISPVFPLLSESESEEQVVVNNPPRAMQKGRIASYIEALTTSRETIVQNNLFVFLSSTERAIDGNIVSIDPSATQIADVLKKYGANIDDEMLDDISAGALTIYRNGVNTSLDEKLYNGDVLTVPSSLLDNLSGLTWEEEVHR